MRLFSPNKKMFWVLFVLSAAFSCDVQPTDVTASAGGWRVFALNYGYSDQFPKSVLLEGAPPSEKHDLSWMAWLIRGKNRTILVDSGFLNDTIAKKMKIRGFQPVHKLLEGTAVPPSAVTDVVITHLHWDHAGNIKPYPGATYWVQQHEIDWARGLVSDDTPRRRGIRLKDLQVVDELMKKDRVALIDGDKQIASGVFLRKGGSHTGGTQWVEVRTGRVTGTVVLASDNAYLYENLEKKIPIGLLLDREDNRRAIIKMLNTASRPGLVVPGHDPLVMKRHKVVAPHVVEIK